jgi:hypothetical protein
MGEVTVVRMLRTTGLVKVILVLYLVTYMPEIQVLLQNFSEHMPIYVYFTVLYNIFLCKKIH